MSSREKNKEEFLKYADKQRKAVKSYTDYRLFGVVIAAAVLVMLFAAGVLDTGAIWYVSVIAIVFIAVWYFLHLGKHLD